MSAHSGGIEEARARVAALWRESARTARLACVWWPWSNSESPFALAQFELEVEHAQRASAEKGGRA